MPLAANIDPHLCIATSDIDLQIISHNIQLGFVVYLEVTDKRRERYHFFVLQLCLLDHNS